MQTLIGLQSQAKETWQAYFQKIKKVCPWSYESFLVGKIKITSQDYLQDLENYDAIVYQVDMGIDALDELAEYLNDEQDTYEFLWSHPDHSKGGNNQTPMPVLIQQDRAILEGLRKGEKGGFNSKAKETSKSSSRCDSKKAEEERRL